MAAQGETHLLIIPNTEHSLTTGIPELITTMPTMYLSISKQQTQDARPSFDYSRDEASGELTITVDAKWKTSKVLCPLAHILLPCSLVPLFPCPPAPLPPCPLAARTTL
jgi:hypothetical protein